jgi:hypothetical protein
MRKQKSLKDPQVGFVECAYGDGDAQAAGKARRHLDCSYGAAFGARFRSLTAILAFSRLFIPAFRFHRGRGGVWSDPIQGSPPSIAGEMKARDHCRMFCTHLQILVAKS